MLDLLLAAFVGGLLLLGLRRPFIWVLAYIYVDIVAPQKISWFLLKSIPISLILFVAMTLICWGLITVLRKREIQG